MKASMKEMKDELGDIIKMTPSTYQISGHTDSSSTFLKVINQQNILDVPIFNKKLDNSNWLKYHNTSWVDFNKKKKKLYIFSFELVFNEQYFRSIFLNKNFVFKGFAQHIPCHFTLKNLIIWMDSNRNICSAFWSDKKITFSYVQAFSIWCHQRVNCFSVKCENIKITSHKIKTLNRL